MKTTNDDSADARADARTCSDERPCIPCYSDSGECIGPYKPNDASTVDEAMVERLCAGLWNEHNEGAYQWKNLPASVKEKRIARMRAALSDAGMGQAAGRADAVPEHVRLLIGRIDMYRLRMSYNDSYFGEPAGLIKSVFSELAHAVNPIYPSGKTAIADPMSGVTVHTATVPYAGGVQCNAPKDGRPRYPECKCDRSNHCEYPPADPLDAAIAKGTKAWAGVPDSFVEDLRGEPAARSHVDDVPPFGPMLKAIAMHCDLDECGSFDGRPMNDAVVDIRSEVDSVVAELRALASKTDHAEDKLGVAPEGWRCFHCSEAFTDAESAALHFGTHERQEPACMIDVAKYREMEALQLRYLDEDADVHRTMRRMETDHQQALRRAEESGYAKGLVDAVKYPQDANPAPDHSAGVGEKVARTGTVADISDEDLLRRAMSNLCSRALRHPAWSRISDVFCLGSTYSSQLCIRFGRHPETGKPTALAQPADAGREGADCVWPSCGKNRGLCGCSGYIVNPAKHPADADAEGGK